VREPVDVDARDTRFADADADAARDAAARYAAVLVAGAAVAGLVLALTKGIFQVARDAADWATGPLPLSAFLAARGVALFLGLGTRPFVTVRDDDERRRSMVTNNVC
jgi:hypothetical protein